MFPLPATARPGRLGCLRSRRPGDADHDREYAVLDLWSEVDEPEDDWFEGHLASSLTPLRAELLRGDRRVAYLAWLLAVQDGEVDEATQEPPVPRGLATGSAPLAALADFLRFDQDLLAAAAESEAEARDEPGQFRAWVKSLPAQEEERWLLRAADNPDLPVGSELLASPSGASTGDRLAATDGDAVAGTRGGVARRTASRRCGASRAGPRRSRRAEQAACGVARRGAAAWQELEQLVEARSYHQAMRLAMDLRAAAAQASKPEEFDCRIAEVKQRHGRRRAFGPHATCRDGPRRRCGAGR